MKPCILCLAFAVACITSCTTWRKVLIKNHEVHISTVNNNVCKKLQGEVILYAIFVDSKYTLPWTEYDINSTLDSIHLATNWLNQQAKASGINLNIKIDYHQNDKNIIPITGNFTRKRLSSTLLGINGKYHVDRWADKIGKEALKTYGSDKSKITKRK